MNNVEKKIIDLIIRDGTLSYFWITKIGGWTAIQNLINAEVIVKRGTNLEYASYTFSVNKEKLTEYREHGRM